jgi:hypothetical protein
VVLIAEVISLVVKISILAANGVARVWASAGDQHLCACRAGINAVRHGSIFGAMGRGDGVTSVSILVHYQTYNAINMVHKTTGSYNQVVP